MPLYCIRSHDNDKPWVDATLRRLIRRRQYAWSAGNMDEYRRLRNKVQRTVKNLKEAFCNRCIHGLRKSNPRMWWHNVKRLTGHRVEHSLTNIATSTYNGDLYTLSNKINNFLQSVSADLQPLCIDQNILENECTESDMNFTIEPYAVERKLSSILMYIRQMVRIMYLIGFFMIFRCG